MKDVTLIADLPNFGPRSAQMLAEAGLRTFGDLRRCGAVAAFVLVKRADKRASLNLLWAIEGAISGLPWRVVAREHRTSLLLALDEYQRSRVQGGRRWKIDPGQ